MNPRGLFTSLVILNLLLSPAGRAHNSDESAQNHPQYFAGRKFELKNASKTNLDSLKHQAHVGNAKAQFALGLIYEQGHGGVKKDLAYAISWYEEASRNGLKAAAKRLASLTSSDKLTVSLNTGTNAKLKY